MAKRRELLIAKNILEFERNAFKARRKLIKLIDVNEELSKDRINSLARHGLIITDCEWSVKDNGRKIEIDVEDYYGNRPLTVSNRNGLKIYRGADYAMIEIEQLGDAGYFSDTYILKLERDKSKKK